MDSADGTNDLRRRGTGLSRSVCGGWGGSVDALTRTDKRQRRTIGGIKSSAAGDSRRGGRMVTVAGDTASGPGSRAPGLVMGMANLLHTGGRAAARLPGNLRRTRGVSSGEKAFRASSKQERGFVPDRVQSA